jgi:hypothetical protein
MHKKGKKSFITMVYTPVVDEDIAALDMTFGMVNRTTCLDAQGKIQRLSDMLVTLLYIS